MSEMFFITDPMQTPLLFQDNQWITNYVGSTRLNKEIQSYILPNNKNPLTSAN